MRNLVLGIVVCGASQMALAADDMKVGGIYCVRGDRGAVRLVKVLALDPGVVHLRSYTNRFSSCPSQVDPKSLTWFIGHMPIDAKGFVASDKPKFVMQTQVTEDELAGYREWQKAGAGVFSNKK